MYNWLRDAIREVAVPKFHLVGEPCKPVDAEYILNASLEVPVSYKNFIVEFQYAKLFRDGLKHYRIDIWPDPIFYESEKYGGLTCIGKYEMGYVYFNFDELDKGKDVPVYEWYGMSGIRKAADSFPDWIEIKYRNARRKYKSKEWKKLLVPLPPFTEHEQTIIAARHQMKWELVRVEDNLDRVIRVTNMSNIVLPFLTLDINRADGSNIGGKFVPISDLLPGETKEYRFSLYEEYPDHAEQQLADRRDPEPGEQEFYWEFR